MFQLLKHPPHHTHTHPPSRMSGSSPLHLAPSLSPLALLSSCWGSQSLTETTAGPPLPLFCPTATVCVRNNACDSLSVSHIACFCLSACVCLQERFIFVCDRLTHLTRVFSFCKFTVKCKIQRIHMSTSLRQTCNGKQTVASDHLDVVLFCLCPDGSLSQSC